ncbi:MAG: NADP-reducing hydrogenase subunit HndA [Syntrophomonadaceae bacterium]|nr:NADP-reducing hydrogenase subunit HndA [Bacillota bacterium]
MHQTAQQSLRQFAKANEIIDKHGPEPAHLINILQDIQEEYRYLPEEILFYVATAMDISPAKVFGVATFYEDFSLDPKGKYVIKVCDGTACHVKKSTEILDTLRRELALSEEKPTTNDMLFTVEVVSCIGACGLAPAIVINDKVYARVTPGLTVDLLNRIREDEASR